MGSAHLNKQTWHLHYTYTGNRVGIISQAAFHQSLVVSLNWIFTIPGLVVEGKGEAKMPNTVKPGRRDRGLSRVGLSSETYLTISNRTTAARRRSPIAGWFLVAGLLLVGFSLHPAKPLSAQINKDHP